MEAPSIAAGLLAFFHRNSGWLSGFMTGLGLAALAAYAAWPVA